jgi:glycosyltransferase involved in cell wall biosynthesis
MVKKKRLLVFASTFPRWKNDTIPPFVYELSKRLTKEFDVHVLAPNYPGSKSYEIMDKMKVHRFRYFFKKYETLAGAGGILPVLKKNKLNFLKVPFFLLGEYLALKKLVKQINPDIIHAHWIIPQGWIASKLKKKFGVPYVVTSHGSDLMGLKGFNSTKKNILRYARAITVVSNVLKDEIISKVDSSLEDKINVIPMGVDSKLFNPNKKDLSIKKKYEINGPFLLFVGRLAPEKGVDLLIEAMPKVIKKNPRAKLMIIGDGTLREELKQKVEKLEIKKNVIFMGWVGNKDLPRYYATSDIFVCPSRREGLGLTFVEAGFSGNFLVGSDIGGIKDIINDRNGMLMSTSEPLEIAEKINQSIEITASPIKKFRDCKSLNIKFDWNIVAKKYGAILK